MIRTLKALPAVILFRRAVSRPVLEADIKRWIEIKYPERAGKSSVENFTWLMQHQQAFRNIFYHRVGSYTSLVGKILLWVVTLFNPPVNTLRFAITKIAPGLFVEYGYVTIVSAESIGENCWINSGVTIGYRDTSGIPTIGNNVYVGAGAKILGPVTVGDNVVIGANAVILRDVPSNCTVGGVPARIIKRDGVRVRESLSQKKTA